MAAWMVYATGVAALLALSAVALDRWARPHGRPVRFVWGGAMLLAAVLPVVAVRSEPLGALFARFVTGPMEGGAVGPVVFLEPLVVGGSTGALFSPGLDAVLAALWVVGSLALLVWWMTARRRLDSRIRGARPWTGPAGADRMVDGVADGRADERECILVTRETGPAVVGALRPRILLPRWLVDGDPDRLALVLGHEREHVAAADPALLSASFLVCAAFPWNPLLWWMSRRLREAVEVDCDRRILEARPDALSRYADTLLAVSARGSVLRRSGAAALAEPRSLLERRIRTMTATRPKHSVLRGLFLAGVAAVALALACSAPSPEGEPGSPTEPGPGDGMEEPGAAVGGPISPGSADLSEIEGGPTHTPFAVGPILKNPPEIQRALEEEYPPLLRDAGIGGQITVWILIDDNGRVQTTEVKESSGAEPLDLAAARVARAMEFVPAEDDAGNPMPVWISLPVKFVADGGPASEES